MFRTNVYNFISLFSRKYSHCGVELFEYRDYDGKYNITSLVYDHRVSSNVAVE